MKKILLTALFIATGAVAQETTTTSAPTTTSDSTSIFSFGGLLDDLKSPLSLSFSNEVGSIRGSDDAVNGFYNDFAAFLSYKLTTKDSLRFNSGFYASDAIGIAEKKNVQWSGTTLRYKRSGILNADKHFVDMSAELRLNAFDKFWYKKGNKRTGSASIRANFSRNLTDKVNLYTQLRYDEYFRTSSAPKVGRRKFVALVYPSWAFAKDWYVASAISFNWYLYGKSDKKPSKKNQVGFAPEVGYSFNKNFSLGAYWNSTPFTSNDGKFFAEGLGKGSTFATYLSYKLF